MGMNLLQNPLQLVIQLPNNSLKLSRTAVDSLVALQEMRQRKIFFEIFYFHFEGYVAEGHGHELVTKPIATCYLASKYSFKTKHKGSGLLDDSAGDALEKSLTFFLTFYFEGYVAEGHGHELVTKPIVTCYLASK